MQKHNELENNHWYMLREDLKHKFENINVCDIENEIYNGLWIQMGQNLTIFLEESGHL